MYVYNNIANEADINACSNFYVEQHNSILNAVISSNYKIKSYKNKYFITCITADWKCTDKV